MVIGNYETEISKWVDGPDGPKLLNTTDKLKK
jgi:hypothetical protein